MIAIVHLLAIVIPTAVVVGLIILAYRAGRSSGKSNALDHRVEAVTAQDKAERQMNQAQADAPKTIKGLEKELDESGDSQ